MTVVVVAGLVLVNVFFLYVLVQFRRDEKHSRRREERSMGVPIAAGQIVVLGPPKSKVSKHAIPAVGKIRTEGAKGESRHDKAAAVSRNPIRVLCSSLGIGMEPELRAKHRGPTEPASRQLRSTDTTRDRERTRSDEKAHR